MSTITYRKLRGDAIEDQEVLPEDLKRSRVILFNQEAKTYFALKSYQEAVSFALGQPIHEVTFGGPQKIKFDIDAPAAEVNMARLDGGPIDTQLIIDTISFAIIGTFHAKYGRILEEDDIIVCQSRGVEKVKCSLHIIVNSYYVDNNDEANEFMLATLYRVPAEIAKWVDQGVYKNVQNFRAPGAVKGGGTKTILTGHPCAAAFIGNIDGATRLPALLTKQSAQLAAPIVRRDDVEAALTLCGELLSSHKLRNAIGAVLTFDRTRPSTCDICRREHVNDNTLMVIIQPCGKVIQKCRHGTGQIVMGEITPPEDPKSNNESIPPHRVQKAILAPVATWQPDADNANVYHAATMRDFELEPTLVVHAPMKMGKTKKLKEHISKNFGANSVIRFISFRQTFSNSIKGNFPDFDLYTDIKGALGGPRIIVQVESLCRLMINDAPDLVILDESESIFEQFDSGLGGQLGANFATLQWLLRYAKHVILMDAFVTDRTMNIVRKIRGGKIHYHRNTYSRDTAIKYSITTRKSEWLGEVCAAIGSGERIAVPINSITEAKTLAAYVEENFPKRKVKLYSSETLMSEKREHFADVNKYWADFDVLIYTPTLTAGVSFEMEHFDRLFGYFTDRSCIAETCMQMMGRVRALKKAQICILIEAGMANLPDTREDIIRSVQYRRTNMLRDMPTTGLSFEFDKNGMIKFHDNDYLVLWTENTLIRNLSRNNFLKRLIDLCKLSGGRVAPLVFTEESAPGGQIRKYTTLRTALADEKYASIGAAPDLTPDRVIQIADAMASRSDISHEDMIAYERYKLRLDYGWRGNIDAGFVKQYWPHEIRNQVRNLANIFRGRPAITISDNLHRIQAEETGASHKHLANEFTQYRDLRRKYMYNRHRIALGLINICGWTSPLDAKMIHIDTLAAALDGADELIRRDVLLAAQEFELLKSALPPPKGDPKRFAGCMRYVAIIVAKQYGCRIGPNKHDPSVYCLAPNVDFTTIMGSPYFTLMNADTE